MMDGQFRNQSPTPTAKPELDAIMGKYFLPRVKFVEISGSPKSEGTFGNWRYPFSDETLRTCKDMDIVRLCASARSSWRPQRDLHAICQLRTRLYNGLQIPNCGNPREGVLPVMTMRLIHETAWVTSGKQKLKVRFLRYTSSTMISRRLVSVTESRPLRFPSLPLPPP